MKVMLNLRRLTTDKTIFNEKNVCFQKPAKGPGSEANPPDVRAQPE